MSQISPNEQKFHGLSAVEKRFLQEAFRASDDNGDFDCRAAAATAGLMADDGESILAALKASGFADRDPQKNGRTWLLPASIQTARDLQWHRGSAREGNTLTRNWRGEEEEGNAFLLWAWRYAGGDRGQGIDARAYGICADKNSREVFNVIDWLKQAGWLYEAPGWFAINKNGKQNWTARARTGLHLAYYVGLTVPGVKEIARLREAPKAVVAPATPLAVKPKRGIYDWTNNALIAGIVVTICTVLLARSCSEVRNPKASPVSPAPTATQPATGS